jgi:16S rRNA (adenine1518-N6/adenine1519-N6)-dimethyltransferase
MMSKELIYVVDKKDRVVGEAPRKGIHDTNLLHRASHIFIFNSKGKMWGSNLQEIV